jgi:periplasmic copper chaperone A
MRIRITIAVAVAGAALILPTVASAHVDISPGEAPAGKPTKFTLSVGHDCYGAATVGLDVKLPPGAADYSANSIPGWKATTDGDQMKWNGSPQPDGAGIELPFRATVFGGMGEQVPFKVIQRCEGGAEIAWIQTGGGQAEGDDPAPVLTLTSTKAAPVPAAAAGPAPAGSTGEDSDAAVEPVVAESAGTNDDSGGIGIGPVVGLILIAASVTAFVVIRRGRGASI